MANNIPFQPMGKTYQVTANVAANTITVNSDSPVNQYLVVSHEKTSGTPRSSLSLLRNTYYIIVNLAKPCLLIS